jgi:hypothetical protein
MRNGGKKWRRREKAQKKTFRFENYINYHAEKERIYASRKLKGHGGKFFM